MHSAFVLTTDIGRFQSTLRIVLESEWEQKKSDAVSYLKQVNTIHQVTYLLF